MGAGPTDGQHMIVPELKPRLPRRSARHVCCTGREIHRQAKRLWGESEAGSLGLQNGFLQGPKQHDLMFGGQVNLIPKRHFFRVQNEAKQGFRTTSNTFQIETDLRRCDGGCGVGATVRNRELPGRSRDEQGPVRQYLERDLRGRAAEGFGQQASGRISTERE